MLLLDQSFPAEHGLQSLSRKRRQRLDRPEHLALKEGGRFRVFGVLCPGAKQRRLLLATLETLEVRQHGLCFLQHLPVLRRADGSLMDSETQQGFTHADLVRHGQGPHETFVCAPGRQRAAGRKLSGNGQQLDDGQDALDPPRHEGRHQVEGTALGAEEADEREGVDDHLVAGLPGGGQLENGGWQRLESPHSGLDERLAHLPPGLGELQVVRLIVAFWLGQGLPLLVDILDPGLADSAPVDGRILELGQVRLEAEGVEGEDGR